MLRNFKYVASQLDHVRLHVSVCGPADAGEIHHVTGSGWLMAHGHDENT